jgi:hypothetical protein
MTARGTLAFFRLWAVVLLATIGLQALEPVAVPLERVSGSAFSAATADVALISARRGDPVETQAAPIPAVPVTMVAVPITLVAVLIAPAEHSQARARGPPPRDRAERLPDLRGPPLA